MGHILGPVVILIACGVLIGRYQLGSFGASMNYSWPMLLTQAVSINALLFLGGVIGKMLGFGSISYDMRKTMLYFAVVVLGTLIEFAIALVINKNSRQSSILGSGK